MERGVTARRACHIVHVSSASPYRKPAPDKDAALRERLRAVWRPNVGYRMAHALVRPEFAPLNVKRVHRLWKEEKLGRVKRYRKKRTGNPVPLSAEGANHVWCVDFCFDACLNGTKLKILAVKDEFTKELLALEVATSFRSLKVQRVLEGLFALRGASFCSRSVLHCESRRTYEHEVVTLRGTCQAAFAPKPITARSPKLWATCASDIG